MPRGPEQSRALDDIAARSDSVQAKFRTGATQTWAWPDETELAAFIDGMVKRTLPFKLTGGLHHAVRAQHSDGPEHGLLNVVAAVAAARAGESVAELTALLAETDTQSLVSRIAALEIETVASIRESFNSYGCCDVTDPINELHQLQLIEVHA